MLPSIDVFKWRLEAFYQGMFNLDSCPESGVTQWPNSSLQLFLLTVFMNTALLPVGKTAASYAAVFPKRDAFCNQHAG